MRDETDTYPDTVDASLRRRRLSPVAVCAESQATTCGTWARRRPDSHSASLLARPPTCASTKNLISVLRLSLSRIVFLLRSPSAFTSASEAVEPNGGSVRPRGVCRLDCWKLFCLVSRMLSPNESLLLSLVCSRASVGRSQLRSGLLMRLLRIDGRGASLWLRYMWKLSSCDLR